MDDANFEALLEKVTAIAAGPHAYLLNKVVDLLYRWTQEPETVSPEDIAAIEESISKVL